MGVADNMSYKNTYHFTSFLNDGGRGDNPSLNLDPKINTTIKGNPFRANVEIEKDEIILAPDLSSLHKGVGKKHSGGGIEVNLKPDTFVFSDDKTLAFTEREFKVFEFDKKGKRAHNNTPAEVLRRNVDMKHYNTLVTNMADVNKDDLAKRSSSLMLEKYIQKLGNIAYLQEEKKNFPTGVPDFALGTAPIYQDDLKEDIMAQKQYLKFGGSITKPQMQKGGLITYMDSRGRRITVNNEKRGNMFTGTIDGKSATFDQATVDRVLKSERNINTMAPSANPMFGNSGQFNNPYAQRPIPVQAGVYNPPPKPVVTPKQEARQAIAQAAPAAGAPDMSSSITGSPAAARIPAAGRTTPSSATTPAKGATGNWGLWNGDKLPEFENKYGYNNAADKIVDLDNAARKLGYTGPKDNKSFQQWLYNSSPENKAVIDKWHDQYKGTGPKAGMMDGKIGIRWQSILGELVPQRTTSVDPVDRPNANPVVAKPIDINTDVAPPAETLPIPGDPNGPAQAGKEINWEFTPWQKVSQGYNAAKYAGVERIMPYRSRMKSSYVDPALVNPEQAIGDMRGMANAQLNATNSLNPIMRNAQAADVYGKLLDQMPGVRSQYDNQNVGIQNQARGVNNQIRNNETAVNMQNDARYYQESATGRANFNNMKGFAADQWMNNVLRDVETNQSLAYNQATMRNPAYSYDFKTGNFTRNKMDIRDLGPTSRTEDDIVNLVDQLKTKGYDQKLIGDIIKSKVFQSAKVYKKGGRVNPYK